MKLTIRATLAPSVLAELLTDNAEIARKISTITPDQPVSVPKNRCGLPALSLMVKSTDTRPGVHFDATGDPTALFHLLAVVKLAQENQLHLAPLTCFLDGEHKGPDAVANTCLKAISARVPSP